jgi:uncharacterized protein YdeI (YjbR/CyaY-like superfamily)
MAQTLKPHYFESPTEFRDWLARHHDTARELLVGYYKKGTGRQGMTWPESVDEALCFGWIDGVRRSVDDERYTIRFTPRRAKKSIWSKVNLARVPELIAAGRMMPAGLAAYEGRDPGAANLYSFERDHVALSATQEKRFRGNRRAWEFFEAQPASYRKPALWWVVSAKQETTRDRRLEQLIADSEAGLRVKHLRRA